MAKGTYKFGKEEKLFISQHGERGKRIYIGTRGTNRAVFDFSAHPYESTYQGVIVYGTWLYIKNIDITGAGDNGMLVEDSTIFAWGQAGNKGKKWPTSMTGKGASYIIFENCKFYKNRDSGWQLKNGASYDTLINCDSYDNYDPTDGGDADGFAPKMNHGQGVHFYGCRAYNNSDDGWDCFIKEDGNRPYCPETVKTTVEYCITYANGTLSNGDKKGNGNGFKMSSKDGYNEFDAIHCLAYGNQGGSSGHKGFDANNGNGKLTMINCSAADNGAAEYSMKTGTSVFVNCNSIGSGSKEIITSSKSSVTTCDWTGSPSDFESMDPSGLTAPRNPDGSLSAKTLSFMKPKKGNTKFIDKGTNINGMKYSGSKADIGWIEVGLDLVGIKDMKIDRTPASSAELITSITSVAKGILNVDFTVLPSGKLDVAIFDINGKKVLHLSNTFGAAGKSQTIDLRKLAAGTYVCNFTFNAFDGVRTDNLKLVKE